MNRNLVAWLLPILLLASCHEITQTLHDDNSLAGTWTLYDVSSISGNADENIEAQMKNDLEVGSIISLFRDSSFTKTEGNGEFADGDWRIKGDTDRLILATHTELKKDSILYIEPPSFGHITRALVIARGDFLYRYTKTWEPLADDKDDPFHRINNRWRITPHGNEDSIRVKERLANYIKHLALLCKAAKERKQAEVSFVYSSGPATITNDGIGILPYGETRRSWKNGFYTDEEAAYAYVLYRNYILEPHAADASTGDRREDNYRILMNMYPAFHGSRREAVKVR